MKYQTPFKVVEIESGRYEEVKRFMDESEIKYNEDSDMYFNMIVEEVIYQTNPENEIYSSDQQDAIQSFSNEDMDTIINKLWDDDYLSGTISSTVHTVIEKHIDSKNKKILSDIQ